MKKILIIDDEKNFCALLKINLELRSDYDVITATSAKEGICAAEQNRPDLILLDAALPDMDGLEALKILKKDEKTASIPVLMLTGGIDKEFREKAMGLYDGDYITKPVDIEVLKSKIEEVLKRFLKDPS